LKRSFKRLKTEVNQQHQKKSEFIFLTVMAILASLILVILVFLIIRSLQSCRNKRREQALSDQRGPRPMKTGDISQDHFQHRGALVVDSGLKGPVHHLADDSTKSQPLKGIEFDSRLNEIVDIGSNVEVLEKSRTRKAKKRKAKKTSVTAVTVKTAEELQAEGETQRSAGDEHSPKDHSFEMKPVQKSSLTITTSDITSSEVSAVSFCSTFSFTSTEDLSRLACREIFCSVIREKYIEKTSNFSSNIKGESCMADWKTMC
uniref:Transmembrane protein n=1 Tax=Haemonchus placei TaxID=6290 RepID=A0A158QJX5_HAEPC